jgi:hypothetical protein
VAAPGGGAGQGCAWPGRRPVCHGEARGRVEGERIRWPLGDGPMAGGDAGC